MGFRLWRRIRIAPGVSLNVSKSGISTSFGRRGAKLTVGRRGTRATVGLPGTGIFYTEQLHGPEHTVPLPGPPLAPTPSDPRRRRKNKIILGCFGAAAGVLALLVVIGLIVGPQKTDQPTSVSTPRASSPSSSPSPSPPPSVTAAPVVIPPPAAPPPKPPTALTVHITDSTYGHVAATTLPGATCTAKAQLPSGSYSTAQGLQGNQVAADGSISWTYRTTSKTTKGTGTHTVTCSLNGQTASDSATFTV